MLSNEQLCTLKHASQAEWMPKREGGKPPHRNTLERWAIVGIYGIRLEATRLGRSLCTSKEAVGRFFAKINQRLGGIPMGRLGGFPTFFSEVPPERLAGEGAVPSSASSLAGPPSFDMSRVLVEV